MSNETKIQAIIAGCTVAAFAAAATGTLIYGLVRLLVIILFATP